MVLLSLINDDKIISGCIMRSKKGFYNMNDMKNKATIFKILHNEIGLEPKVVSYSDENEKSSIDIYIGINRPDMELTTYSTIGLSEYSIDLIDGKDREIRVELISVCESKVEEFPNIIASCAMRIIKDNYSCSPGTVNVDAISDYYSDLEMKHIYFTVPYLWNELQEIELDGHIVNWLLAVPISDKELEYLDENGAEAFEELLEKHEIDIFDIYRKSIL